MTHPQTKCATDCPNQSPLCRWCIPTGWRFADRKCDHVWEKASSAAKREGHTEIVKELKTKKHKSGKPLRFEIWLWCERCERYKGT